MRSFLPEDFDFSAPVVLLAGRGDYPRLVAQEMKKRCEKVFVFSFEEESEIWLKACGIDYAPFEIGQVGAWLKALKKCNARYVLLAGQIKPKKLFQGLNPDLKALWLLARLKQKNATTIFTTLIHEIEALGITVLDARCFVEDQLVSPGNLTKKSNHINKEDLTYGIDVCRSVAKLNIGQSLIIRDGTIVIVEAFDGTDAMIERAGTICKGHMGLIKLAKTDQDFRFDVPVFGEKTLQKMSAAGIQWAALESQKTLILNKEAILEEAEKLDINLLGF